MAESFRWGIIGPGRIAEKFANDLKVVEGAERYAVASRSGSKDLAGKFGAAAFFKTYEGLAASPKVDAIYIATPHPMHADAAELCLRAGKPVVAEKPLTVNSKEAEGLIWLAQQQNTFLMEAMWTRFLPVHRQVRAWLEEGRIGEVYSVASNFGFRMTRGAQDRWLNPKLGGGALLDIGIYPLSVTQMVLGADPVEVQAQAILGETRVDVHTAVNLRYANGAVAQFTCSFLSDLNGAMTIIGTDGKITIPKQFYLSESAELRVYEGKNETFKQKHRSGGFEYQIEEAMACIRAGQIETPIMSHMDSLGNMRVMDEIRAQIGVKYPFE